MIIRFRFLLQWNTVSRNSFKLIQIKLSDISKDLREQILSSQSTLKNKDVIYVKPEKTSLTIDDVKKMSKKEKENLWNKIIDNGVENMSEEDKIILKFLSE